MLKRKWMLSLIMVGGLVSPHAVLAATPSHAQRDIATLEEFKLGKLPSIILTYDEYALDETYSIRKAAGKSVELRSDSKRRPSKTEEDSRDSCRFLSFEDAVYTDSKVTITGFTRDPEDSKKAFVHGVISGIENSENLTDSYCRNGDEITVTAHELMELRGPFADTHTLLRKVLGN